MSDTTYITVEDSGSHYTLVHNNCRLIANESYIPFDWNPLNLPAKTIRFQYDDPSYSPTAYGYHHGVWTQVSSSPNIWDYTYTGSDWSTEFAYPVGQQYATGLCLGANLEGVTNCWKTFDHAQIDFNGCYFYAPNVTNVEYMFAFGYGTHFWTAPYLYLPSVTNFDRMFYQATRIVSCPVFDTHNAVSMNEMFSMCYSLSAVPQLDLTNVTSAADMFLQTEEVETGAYDLYVQASSKSIPLTNHYDMFMRCGYNTVSGLSDLRQIPGDWGGLQY